MKLTHLYWLRGWIYLDGNSKPEHGPMFWFWSYTNDATHQLNELARYWETQTSASKTAGRRILEKREKVQKSFSIWASLHLLAGKEQRADQRHLMKGRFQYPWKRIRFMTTWMTICSLYLEFEMNLIGRCSWNTIDITFYSDPSTCSEFDSISDEIHEDW